MIKFKAGMGPLIVAAASSLIAVVVSIICLSSGYFRVFQNLFYFPIIVWCVYFARKGFIASVLLALAYLSLVVWYATDASILQEASVRVVMFIAIAGTLSFLSIKRIKAETAWQENEQRLRSVVEGSFAGVYVVQDGIFTYLNSNAASFAGYKPEELKGKPSTSVLFPDDVKKCEEKSKKMLRGEDLSPYEFRIVTKDGQIRWIMETVASIQYGGKSSVLGNSMDITDRKLAEESLRKSEELRQSIFTSVPHALFGVENRTIFFANDAMEQVFGWKKEEMLGKSTRILFRNDDEWKQYGERLYSAMQEQPVVIFEWDIPFVRKDGDEIYCRMSVSRVGRVLNEANRIVATFEDITERRRSDEALRESQQRLSDIIEFLPDATLVIDRDGKVMAWNRAIENMTGIKAEEMLGRDDYEYAIPFYGERRPILIDLALRPDPQQEKKYTAIQRSGDILFGEAYMPQLASGSVHLSATASVLRNAQGDIIAAIECIRDNTERKRMESDIVEQRNLSNHYLQTAGVMMCALNSAGEITLINKKGLEILGYQDEHELVGKNWFDVSLPKDVVAEVKQVFNQLMSGNIQPVEYYENPIRAKSGEERIVAFHNIVLRDKEGKISGILSSGEDITDRKTAQEQLRKSVERFDLAVQGTNGGIWDWDIEKNSNYFSPRMCELLGYAPEEIRHEFKTFDFLLHLDDRERVMAQLRQHFEEHVPYDIEYRLRTKTGEYRWFHARGQAIWDQSGKPYRMAGSILDITERKQAEDALRESEEKFRKLFNNAEAGMFRTRLDGSEALDSNDKYLSILGMTREEFIGQPSVIVWYDPKEREEMLKTLKAQGHVNDLEFRLRNRAGEVRNCITSLKLYPETGILEGSILDITDRKRAESERRELQERLQRAEKMEALGMLAGGVAHDLNNALGILVGYSELLADDLDEKSPLRAHVDYIRQGGQRASAIVQDLLTLARRGVQTSEIVDLNSVIDEFQDSPEFEKICSFHPDVRVETLLSAGLLNIKGSPVHLRKTVMNLVSNAAEAMPSGGKVTIETRNLYLDRPVPGYDDIQEGDYVVLSVSDTGEGIAGKDLKKIFEPFYTKKVMGRSGTGLGLAVVWGTVKDHRGYIHVQSEEGKGTTFSLYFPVTREEVSREGVPVEKSEYRGRGERILVVDDVPGQRELAARMLGKLHYQVATAASGEEAVEYLRANRVDLVVLDMIMDPGMDGLDTYREILRLHPKQKAIIVSGFSESDRVREAQALGAGAYVRKPYMQEVLGLAVKKELDKKVLH